MKTVRLNLGLALCLVLGLVLTAAPVKAEGEPPAWPLAGFWNDPPDPSIYDWITMGLYGYAPGDWVCQWDFGNGSAFNDCFASTAARYNADGDYTVSVRVTNSLGQGSSATRIVSVRTHDVAISKFTVPQSAKAGQTRQLSVNLRNNRYPEVVRVELYKSTPSGYALFGALEQAVPVRVKNQTTVFSFNYTFTAEDARSGKVTFRALAFLQQGVRDALPLDNEAIALPTIVLH